MSRRIWFLLGICVPVIFLDQWTKALVHSSFRLGESIPLADSFFSFTYVRNYGAAFGLLSRAPEWFRWPFFLVMPVVACALILLFYARLKHNQKVPAFALSLILAGALGNILSRVRYGYVVDFLDVHWKDIYHWPAFNLADCAIVIAVTFLFLSSLFKENQAGERIADS